VSPPRKDLSQTPGPSWCPRPIVDRLLSRCVQAPAVGHLIGGVAHRCRCIARWPCENSRGHVIFRRNNRNTSSHCAAECGCNRKGKLGGLGTLVILGAVGAVVVIGMASPAPAPPKSRLPNPSRPLFKPEPGLLLSDRRLDLTAAQRQRVEGIANAWRERRAQLEAQIATYRPTQGTKQAIESQLGGYSDLSREYDLTRDALWKEALSVLTEAQKKHVKEKPL
jgi:hypothetical protein